MAALQARPVHAESDYLSPDSAWWDNALVAPRGLKTPELREREIESGQSHSVGFARQFMKPGYSWTTDL